MCAFYIEAKTKTHRIAYLEYGFYIKCNFLIGVRFFFLMKKKSINLEMNQDDFKRLTQVALKTEL